jgi:hypothetical protein
MAGESLFRIAHARFEKYASRDGRVAWRSSPEPPVEWGMHPRTRELLEYLDEQRAVLHTAFDAIPGPLRDRAPAEGRWSAAAIIEHLAIVEARVSARLSALISEARATGLGPEPSLEPVLPTINVGQVVDRGTRRTAPEAIQPTGLSADAAWTSLEEAGTSVRNLMKASDGLALGTVSMPHPVFGPSSAYHWFAFVGAHEARHAAQIREIAGALPASC